jgi:hypothetical protein
VPLPGAPEALADRDRRGAPLLPRPSRPDFLPLFGFADDAAVLFWVANRMRKDLDAFLRWEVGQGPVIDVEPVATPID